MVTLSSVGVGVGTAVGGGGVGVAGAMLTGGSVTGGLLAAPLRLMLTSTTTARMTASRSMPPKISCHLALLAARSPAGVPGSVLALVAGTRSLCLTLRVPQ